MLNFLKEQGAKHCFLLQQMMTAISFYQHKGLVCKDEVWLKRERDKTFGFAYIYAGDFQE